MDSFFVILEKECPYCNKTLPKQPSRQSKCPFCGYIIYLKYSPREKGQKIKHLVTAEQALEIEQEWEVYNKQQSFDHLLSQFEITVEEYDRYRAKYPDKGIRDLLHIILQSKAQAELSRPVPDFHKLQMWYYQFAYWSYEHKYSFKNFLLLSRTYSLLNIKRSGAIQEVEIHSSDDSCPTCKAQNKRKISIDDALKTNPLPCEGCSTEFVDAKPGWCRCYYSPVLPDISDEEGTMSQEIEDKGNGIKVTTVDPKTPSAETQWRKAYLNELRSINGKLTWFVVLSVLAIIAQLINWMMG